jgi:hypothetical protein
LGFGKQAFVSFISIYFSSSSCANLERMFLTIFLDISLFFFDVSYIESL